MYNLYNANNLEIIIHITFKRNFDVKKKKKLSYFIIITYPTFFLYHLLFQNVLEFTNIILTKLEEIQIKE